MAKAAEPLAFADALAGRGFVGSELEIKPTGEFYRISLRCGQDARGDVSERLGLELPAKPMHSITKRSRSALWLGPDEWLVLDAREDIMGDLAGCDAVHSAVDISHRNTAVVISGDQAGELLNHGCPLDLSLNAFPRGSCTRTVFGKAEIVLWRSHPALFHVEVWRSFADYLWAHLMDAAADFN